MKFVQLNDTSRIASPRADALRGFNIEQELRAAARGAIKPISKKLAAYRTERARLEANVARWNSDSYAAKLAEVTDRAANGDEEAAAAIEAGAVASRQTFAEMHARAHGDLDTFDLRNAGVFNEAADLIQGPMSAVVDKGQQILSDVLTGLGIEGFELTGQRNHINYVVGQLRAAGRNAPCDLSWFWTVAA
jgi:hypothetical protein